MNIAYDKLVKYLSKNKNNFFNNQNKKKIEKQLKIKESQFNYNQKVTLLLMKEIYKYNKKIKTNSNIDENIKQENPLIIKKEEEYKYILNKLNEEIDILKQDIQALKIIRNKHLMCNRIENKLLDEIEFYKLEKQKKLNYIESLNKFKYIQKLRKRKVLIEREQFNNSSTNNFVSELKLPSEPTKFENSIIFNALENKNEIEPILPNKKIIGKNVKYNLSLSRSSKDINIFEKAKKYEQDKKAAEKKNEKRNAFREKLFANSFSSLGLYPNKLFTDEEKSIIQNYKFIPEEKVDNCEKKYTNMLAQINKTEKEIKKIGKQNQKKILNIKCKIINNDKKQKDLEKISANKSITKKQNETKIIKIKLLIKEKLQEEKQLDLDLNKQNMNNQKLREILDISNNFENLTSIEENDSSNVNSKNQNSEINNNTENTQNNNEMIENNENEKREETNEQNNEENNLNIQENQLIKENENNQ